MGGLLLLPVPGQAENAAEQAAVDGIVHADFDIVLHAQVVKQADVLEGAGDARLVDLHCVHVVGVHSVQQNGASGGLVHLGQQVEHCGLARAVGTDQAGDLSAADGHVELVDGGEAAEVDAQVLGLQDGALVHIPLWNLVDAGHRDQLGLGSLYAAHCLLPPPFTAAAWGASARSRWNSREKKPFRVGLLVASMTRISTMAYTSMR